MKHSLPRLVNAFLLSVLLSSHYLFYHAYPLFAPESLCLILVFSFFLIIPYFLLSLCRLIWPFDVLLFLLFFDLTVGFGFRDKVFWPVFFIPRSAPNFIFLVFSPVYFVVGQTLEALPNRFFILMASYLLFLTPFTLIGYALRDKLPKIFMPVLAAMILTTALQHILSARPLIRIARNEHPNTPIDKPNILVMILDEHIGIEGIPAINESAKNLKEKLIHDYVQNRFLVYGRSYSNYYNTFKSVPSILNYALFKDGSNQASDSYEVLEKFYRQGYAVNIYQSNYYGYCAPSRGRYRQCLEYDKNSIGFLYGTSLPIHEKVRVMMASFFEAHKSAVLRKAYWLLSEKYAWLPWGHVEAIAAMQVFELIKRDMALQKSGNVFFAHLLIPHSPYLYDSECRLKGTAEWEQRLITNHFDSAASWRRKSERYLEQVGCTHKKVSELFEVMRNTGSYDKATIVIFGDHGSRIYSAMPHEEQKDMEWLYENSTPRDLIELFSDFLVVKNGDRGLQTGRYIPEKTPAVKVIGELFGLSPQGSSIEDFDKIYMQTKGSKTLKPYDMIDF